VQLEEPRLHGRHSSRSRISREYFAELDPCPARSRESGTPVPTSSGPDVPAFALRDAHPARHACESHAWARCSTRASIDFRKNACSQDDGSPGRARR
jgi:hypothetical protein